MKGWGSGRRAGRGSTWKRWAWGRHLEISLGRSLWAKSRRSLWAKSQHPGRPLRHLGSLLSLPSLWTGSASRSLRKGAGKK